MNKQVVSLLKIDLSGYKVLVTASSRGIGRGIAEAVLEAGSRVFINGLHEESVVKSISDLQTIYGPGRVSGFAADLSDLASVRTLVSKATEFLGGIDAVVYVTGPPKPGTFKELKESDWKHGVNLLIMSAIGLIYEALPYLQKSSNPSITLLTSVAVKEPIPTIALSNVLRITMHGLVRTLAKELGREKVRVNAIMPGYIMTDRIRQLSLDRASRENKDPTEVIEDISERVPLNRIGEPREVGYLTAFLISPLAAYINGASIPIDGGLLNSVF